MSIETLTKIALKRSKLGNFWNSYYRGHFRHSQKNSKISTNTYRTKVNLCELNSVGDPLKIEYKFGA